MEIQEQIFVSIVGGQLLHMRLGVKGEKSHSICIAEHSEEQNYKFFMTRKLDILSGEVLSCRERHRKCRWNAFEGGGMTPQERSTLMLQLAVLRTCHQIYELATYVLWKSNTFSFENFVTSLHPWQKVKLEMIHLRAACFPGSLPQWNKALRKSIIDVLQGVRSIQLSVDHKVGYEYNEDGTSNEPSELQERLSQPFSQLLVLPSLRHVTVVFIDIEFTSEVTWGEHWTDGQKRTIAEGLGRKLLYPTADERKAAEVNAQEAEQIHLTILDLNNPRKMKESGEL